VDRLGLGLVLYCLTYFQDYFNYIVAVSFIGCGNQSIWRKPPTCCKSLTTLSHNVVSSTHRRRLAGYELTTLLVICSYNTIRTTTDPEISYVVSRLYI